MTYGLLISIQSFHSFGSVLYVSVLIRGLLICSFAGQDFAFSRGHFGSGSKSSFPGAGLVKPQWDLSRLPKFEKHFYKEHPETASRSAVCMLM